MFCGGQQSWPGNFLGVEHEHGKQIQLRCQLNIRIWCSHYRLQPLPTSCVRCRSDVKKSRSCITCEERLRREGELIPLSPSQFAATHPRRFYCREWESESVERTPLPELIFLSHLGSSMNLHVLNQMVRNVIISLVYRANPVSLHRQDSPPNWD